MRSLTAHPPDEATDRPKRRRYECDLCGRGTRVAQPESHRDRAILTEIAEAAERQWMRRCAVEAGDLWRPNIV